MKKKATRAKARSQRSHPDVTLQRANAGSRQPSPWSLHRLLTIPRDQWLPPLLFVMLVFAVYIPALNSGFIWDDNYYVTENPTLRSAKGLQAIWGYLGATPQYYPLVFSTFWLEFHLWGLEPFGYHFNNVLIHALNGLLLWLVLSRLRVPGGGLAALVFAIHPVGVESVAWVTERKNVLSGFFYLLSLLACLRLFRLDEDPSNSLSPAFEAQAKPWPFWAFYLMAFAAFCCALFSKTVTCSLPAVVLLLVWWKRGLFGWREILPLAPFFLIGLIMAFVTVHMEVNYVGAKGEVWSLSLGERFLVAGRALWFYLGKIILPINLTFIYPRWKIDSADALQYLFPLAAVALGVALWLWRRQLTRAPLTAALFFVMTLTPALGIFDVYPMQYSFVADHFQYLAAIGPITLIVGLAVFGLRRLAPPLHRAGELSGGAIVLLLCVLTWHQGGIYKDVETLWRQNLEFNPDSWMAHNNLGMNLAQGGNIEEAKVHFRESLRLHRHPRALNNMANVLAMQGHNEEALEHFRRASELEPNNPFCYVNTGRLLSKMGQRAEAIEHFRRALAINPRFLEGLYDLGDALNEGNNWDEAKTVFQQALKRDSSSLRGRLGLANALAGGGQVEEAIKHYQQLLNLHPNSAEGHLGLAQSLARVKRSKEALMEYQLAMRLKPTWFAAHAIAWIMATNSDSRLRNGAEAVSLAEKACEETGEVEPTPLATLAAAYAEVGRFDKAVETAQRAIGVAQRADNPALAKEYSTHLQAYQAKHPYREQ